MKILLVCSANMCRSAMAEGLLKFHLKEVANPPDVSSAGTLGFWGYPPLDEAIEVCNEVGVDISYLSSTPLTPALVREADIILVMEQEHKDTVLMLRGHPGKIRFLGEFDTIPQPDPFLSDPVGKEIEAFRECRDRIIRCIEGLLKRLVISSC